MRPRPFLPTCLAVLLVLLATPFAYSQQPASKAEGTHAAPAKTEAAKPDAAKAEAPMQMMTYQMVLFKHAAPGATATHSPKDQGAKTKEQGATTMTKMRGHLANMARLNHERINLIYGPFTDSEPKTATMNELVGIAILDVPDAETAKKHYANDPFIQAGEMIMEVKPWFGPKGYFNPPTVPASDDPTKMQMEPLIFGILLRGPATKITPPVHNPAQREEIQKGHLAYMNELHKQGKLVMAGPFMPGPSGDAGDWRGIVVYRVGSVAEAQQLAANDPAAKAGRLAIEARPWMTLKGILK